MTFNVREWRKAQGDDYTQTKAAGDLGVSLATWRSWEYGRRKPPKMLKALIDAKCQKNNVVRLSTEGLCYVLRKLQFMENIAFEIVPCLGDPTAYIAKASSCVNRQINGSVIRLMSVHETEEEALKALALAL